MKKEPFLIVIDGPIGSGKSTTAKLLHKKLKRTALISLDRIKFLISDFRRNSYEDLQLASDVGKEMTKEYLKHKINVIVEKAFTRAEHLEDFIKITRGKKVRLYVYQIEADIKTRLERVKQRPFPEESNKKPSERKIKKNYMHYMNYKYKKAKVFNSEKLSPKKIVMQIMDDLK